MLTIGSTRLSRKSTSWMKPLNYMFLQTVLTIRRQAIQMMISCHSEETSQKNLQLLCLSIERGLENNIINLGLATTIDRTKLSDRKATFMLAATARSLGNDVIDYSINRSSICRERQKLRQDISQQLKSKFNQNTPLTVHWDGKRLKDLTGKELLDRLSVILSGLEIKPTTWCTKIDLVRPKLKPSISY